MANPLPPLDGLDVEGDNASVGHRWEKWKRALLIYLDASDISTPQKRRATLLHFGGINLQEIYYNLPGAHIEATENVDVFKVAIEKLDEFLLPKQNQVYERHVFRLIKQEEGENFERFLLRLRKQADKCNFDKKDDHLIDQITEKCTSTDLRKKILTIGDSITLDIIATEANTLEVVNNQMENYGNKKQEVPEVNAIFNNKREEINKNRQKYIKNKMERCGSCGSRNHQSEDDDCPAKGKTCHQCNKIGHFRQYCRSVKQATKRRIDEKYDSSEKNKKKRIEVDYVFNVDNGATVKCIVGGVKLNMVVDSGCRVNLITQNTWNVLKKEKVKVGNPIRKPDKTLFAYGSNTPLSISGSFETTIGINGREEHAKVYVVLEGTRDLLGKETATRLGVLKIGMEVNKIGEMPIPLPSEPFPKMKDVLVKIPIDESH